MKEFKGTKGEWKVKSTISGLETEIFCGKIRVAQAKHYNNGKEGEENYFKNDPLDKEGFANAKLIAAAPELLNAAIKALNDCCDLIGTEAGNSLEEAINKALN